MGLCKPEWPLLWFRVSCLQRASRTLSNDPSFCLGFPRRPSFVFIAWTVGYGHCDLCHGSRSAAAETCAVCSPGVAWAVSWYTHMKCAVSILWQSCRHLWTLQRLSHSGTLTSWWRRKNYPTCVILFHLLHPLPSHHFIKTSEIHAFSIGVSQGLLVESQKIVVL